MDDAEFERLAKKAGLHEHLEHLQSVRRPALDGDLLAHVMRMYGRTESLRNLSTRGAVALVVLGALVACNPPAPRYRSVTVGTAAAFHSYGCAINLADEVYCWDAQGSPSVHGLAVPAGYISGTPVRVEGLPPVALVRASNDVTFASTSDAGVFWWGAPPSGEDAGCSSFCTPRRVEGIGSVSALASSGQTACGVVGTDVWCWGSSAYGELGTVSMEPDRYRRLPPRMVLSGARDVTMASARVCATLLDSTVTCWGDGTAMRTAVATQDVAAYANGCALTRDGILWCREQAGTPRHGVTVLGIREGAFNRGNCIAVGDEEVFCWDYDDAFDGGRTIAGLRRPQALAVAPLPRGARAVDENACAIVGDEVKCWGLDDADAGLRTLPAF